MTADLIVAKNVPNQIGAENKFGRASCTLSTPKSPRLPCSLVLKMSKLNNSNVAYRHVAALHVF